MRISRLLVLLLTLAFALPVRAATDYTDIWWTAGGIEDGWGVNLAQNANSIFATFFVYDTAGKPVWYTAFLTRTVGETYAGNVFARTGGTWFGAPTWVAPPPGVAVGTAAFVASSPFRGTLTYTVSGTSVAKTVERATLAGINLAGPYLGAITARRDGCMPNQIFELDQFVISQDGLPGTVRIDQLSTVDGSLICRMEGPGVQYGGVIDIPDASYTCSAGLATRAHVIGLRPTATGFEARWFTDFMTGCTESGNMTGATQIP